MTTSVCESPHVRDSSAPCAGCGTYWVNDVLVHDNDCSYLAGLQENHD